MACKICGRSACSESFHSIDEQEEVELRDSNKKRYIEFIKRTENTPEYKLEVMTLEYDRLRAEVERLKAEVDRFQEREATVCPEDFSFEEVIKSLRAEVERKDVCVAELASACEVAFEVLEACVKPLGGCDDRAAISNAKDRLRMALDHAEAAARAANEEKQIE